MPRNISDSKPIRSQQQAMGFDASAEHIGRVAQLIASGDSKQAVNVAKDAYKHHGGPAVEASLVEAYLARIASLLERGLALEAKTLADRVQQRHPTSRERVRNLLTPSAGRDDLNTVLQQLNDPSLSPETEAAVDEFVRCRVTDLDALSQSSVLPAEHPLRTTSAALAKAFEAVTTGPVEEAALSLPEVSRRSPLASWKMLVRAIGAFYRHDDELCRKCLTSIEADSAASRLTPALCALLSEHKDKNGGKPPNGKTANGKPALTPAALVLVNLLGGGVAPLRAKLQKLDPLLESEGSSLGKVINEIRDVVALCRQSCPSILERLKLQITIKAMLPVPNPEKISAALGGPSPRGAYFWQLLARFFESHGDPFLACATWEEFRRHALREQWFPRHGVEVAALYSHMVGLLDRIPEEGFEHRLRSFLHNFRGFKEDYKGQPPEIRSVMLPPGNEDFNFLRPERLLEQICEMDPSPDNFQRWLAWFSRRGRGGGDRVAQGWYAAFPNDVRPLLHLMRSAERSKALQKAFNYMVQAERVDGLNAEVRKARLRLHVSIAIRHLRQKKARLSELDLQAIEALPQAQQGDRPAFVAALRWVSSTHWGSQEERDRSFARVEQLLESKVAATTLVSGMGFLCKMKTGLPTISTQIGGLPLISGAARTCALGEDMGYLFHISPQLAGPMLTALLGNDVPPDLPGLRALGDAASRSGDRPIAYAISGVGLRGEPAGYAQFLFLRVQSLPVWEEERYDDCLDAATELARRQRDHDLLDKIGAWREDMEFDLPNVNAAMDTEEIERVIQREKNAGLLLGYPPKPKPAQSFDLDDGFEDEFFDPDSRRKPRRGGPSLPDIKEMADKFGIDVVAAALKEMFESLGGTKKNTSKSRRGRALETDGDDFEIPF